YDPREAAGLAALWSLSEPETDRQGRSAIALGVTAPAADPRDSRSDLGSALNALADRVRRAMARSEKSLSAPVVERRDRLEHGQGELWLLLGTPCGTTAEGDADAGQAALGLVAVIAARADEDRSVTLEPWITPDGVGVIAHAARLRFESAED